MRRIIFTGKGGVGKTTILSNLVRLLAKDGHHVLTIDCDPSMNLAMSLGIPLTQIVSLAEDKARFQERLDAQFHPHTHDADEDDDHEHESVNSGSLSDYIISTTDGVSLIVMGTIPFGGAGCLCAPIALVKMLVNYLSSGTEEYDYIIIDSQAGVEIFGRGLASEFDLSLVITEPTPKSLEVAKHGARLARELGVKKQIAVVNKVETDEDLQFATRELDGSVDHIISMRYDISIKEADKKGVLLLDVYPNADVLDDISRIKSYISGEA
jgi:CO dehydrogenase maturation factor